MTIRHINIFLAVCEAGENTTKAAELLHMSQPAVSLAIRELEDYYGVALFDRIGRRLSITEAGKRFRGGLTEGFSRIEPTVDVLLRNRVEGRNGRGVRNRPSGIRALRENRRGDLGARPVLLDEAPPRRVDHDHARRNVVEPDRIRDPLAASRNALDRRHVDEQRARLRSRDDHFARASGAAVDREGGDTGCVPRDHPPIRAEAPRGENDAAPGAHEALSFGRIHNHAHDASAPISGKAQRRPAGPHGDPRRIGRG